MSRALIRRWRERGGRTVRIVLPFEDIMEFALALLSVRPAELEALGWAFADRKRLLDHFLAAGKSAQGTSPEALPGLPIEIAIPQRDIDRLRRFARRELPKAASNAAMLDRVLRALNAASHRAAT
jgi:hypothetical protein